MLIRGNSSPEDVRARYLDVLTPVAEELNLTLEYHDRTAAPSYEATVASSGHIRLSDIFDEPLAPAPVTPTFGSPAWELLAGTIQSTLAGAIREYKPIKPSVVGPELAIGNTDTHYYWDLTRNIFRYSHLGSGDAYNGAHTINEGASAPHRLSDKVLIPTLQLFAPRASLRRSDSTLV